MTDYNDGKWHVWSGGECPVHPETIVEVALTDHKPSTDSAEQWFWDESRSRIIAFRVIKEHKEPREFWIINGHSFETKSEAEGFRRGSGISRSIQIIHVREVLE